MDEVERNNAGVKDKTAVATIGKLGMGTITRFFGKLLLYTCTPQSVYRAQQGMPLARGDSDSDFFVGVLLDLGGTKRAIAHCAQSYVDR